jgi:acyl carrier protein
MNINVCDLLYEICEDKHVYDKDFDLIESGLLDSFAFIELFTKLEDIGIVIIPTRIDRNMLKTPRLLEELINNSMNS